MSEFTTRVELHDASGDDYTNLHEAMQGEGFSRLIQGSKGKYRLPWGEYNFEGDQDSSHVLEAAKRAAKSTGCEFEVLVTESVRRAWQGLDKV